MCEKQIMIIEPDPSLQIVLIDIFIQFGYNVCAAVSADDVVDMLSRFKPEVVIISGDRRGTYASGWNVAKLINDVDATLPLIMLTTNQLAHAELGQTFRGRLFAAGLLKPFNLDELLATVAGCLDGAARQIREPGTPQRERGLAVDG